MCGGRRETLSYRGGGTLSWRKQWVCERPVLKEEVSRDSKIKPRRSSVFKIHAIFSAFTEDGHKRGHMEEDCFPSK